MLFYNPLPSDATVLRVTLRYRLLLAAFLFSLQACTTNSVTFEAEPGTSVSLVTWDRLASDGTSLGASPVTVPSSDLAGKVVKLAAKGKDPVYWVLEEANAEALKVHVELPVTQCPAAQAIAATDKKNDECKPEKVASDKPEKPGLDNRSMRLTLRAYKALFSHDLALTQRLAQELHDLHPELAVSSLLSGLANLAGGDRAQARTALIAAKTLDPEDPDIDELLKLTQ